MGTDPATVDSGPPRRIHDLPGRSLRLVSESIGVKRVFVNGRIVVEDGRTTRELPGRVLRSGRDTETVAARS